MLVYLHVTGVWSWGQASCFEWGWGLLVGVLTTVLCVLLLRGLAAGAGGRQQAFHSLTLT